MFFGAFFNIILMLFLEAFAYLCLKEKPILYY